MDEVALMSKGTVAEATLQRDGQVFRQVFGENARAVEMYERMRRHVKDVAPAEQFFKVPASLHKVAS
jgi:hypothetical protein